jgi:hypothetical protein
MIDTLAEASGIQWDKMMKEAIAEWRWQKRTPKIMHEKCDH